jgi:polyisoprenoid-binding protein YceI
MSDTATLVPTGTWNVDPTHSRVGFAVKHLGIATVRGVFKEFEGTLEVGEDLASAKARGTVKTASIDTSEAARDEHLRGSDFFDAESYPEITFESTSIESTGADEWKVVGDLTIHGITNEIELDVEVGGTENDPWGHERVGLEANGQISRGAYEMKFNIALGSGNVAVGDKVKIILDISAVKDA